MAANFPIDVQTKVQAKIKAEKEIDDLLALLHEYDQRSWEGGKWIGALQLMKYYDELQALKDSPSLGDKRTLKELADLSHKLKTWHPKTSVETTPVVGSVDTTSRVVVEPKPAPAAPAPAAPAPAAPAPAAPAPAAPVSVAPKLASEEIKFQSEIGQKFLKKLDQYRNEGILSKAELEGWIPNLRRLKSKFPDERVQQFIDEIRDRDTALEQFKVERQKEQNRTAATQADQLARIDQQFRDDELRMENDAALARGLAISMGVAPEVKLSAEEMALATALKLSSEEAIQAKEAGITLQDAVLAKDAMLTPAQFAMQRAIAIGDERKRAMAMESRGASAAPAKRV